MYLKFLLLHRFSVSISIVIAIANIIDNISIPIRYVSSFALLNVIDPYHNDQSQHNCNCRVLCTDIMNRVTLIPNVTGVEMA